MTCIGTSSEKLLTFAYRGFKFLDSCNFLKVSLTALCDNLKNAGVDKFEPTRRVFEDDEQFDLMLQKGVIRMDIWIHSIVLKKRNCHQNRRSSMILRILTFPIKITNVHKKSGMRFAARLC